MKANKSDNTGVTLGGRVVSSTLGAVLTSMILTPFDVVKTRLQGQIATPIHNYHEACIHPLPHPHGGWFIKRFNGLADTWCYECESPRPALKFTGTIDTAAKLIQYEGAGSLWRGWSATLLRSVPQIVIYFSLYDYVKDTFVDKNIPIAPFWAGSIARTVTTIAVSPIELIRTKQQALNYPSSMIQVMRSELAKPNGFKNLWRGAAPTLWRDVPFSALYWTFFESTREKVLSTYYPDLTNMSQSERRKTNIYASFVAGASSGTIAATLTHPFDLVKTRRQIELYEINPRGNKNVIPTNTINILKTIIREEGYRGLLTGWIPRVAEIAPACAIMISTYEIAKSYFRVES
jgi:solute carrier family 25 protein 39/40